MKFIKGRMTKTKPMKLSWEKEKKLGYIEKKKNKKFWKENGLSFRI